MSRAFKIMFCHAHCHFAKQNLCQIQKRRKTSLLLRPLPSRFKKPTASSCSNPKDQDAQTDFFCHGGPQFLRREWESGVVSVEEEDSGGPKFLKRSLGRQDIDLQRGTFNWMVFHSGKEYTQDSRFYFLFPIFSLILAGAATRSCQIFKKKSETSFLYVRLS